MNNTSPATGPCRRADEFALLSKARDGKHIASEGTELTRTYILPKQYGTTLDRRFAETGFAVRASNYEISVFRNRYAIEALETGAGRRYRLPRMSWEEDHTCTRPLDIGSIGEYPVTLRASWAVINGCRVMFWDLPSEVTDEVMAQRFVRALRMPKAAGHRIYAPQFTECVRICLAHQRRCQRPGRIVWM